MDRRLTIDMFPGGVDERVLKRGDICDEKIIQSVLGTCEEIDEDEDILQNENAYSQHFIGDTRLYHTFSRSGKTEPYRYAGLCAWGENGNMHPDASKKVFIISQYHDETPKKIAFNAAFVAAIAYNCVTRYGDIPIVPHLYFPNFLMDVEWERDFGIEAGHLMMRMCDSVILATIDGRISDGMKKDLEYATVQLALSPKEIAFTRAEAARYIKEVEKERYEEWNRAKHR